LLDVSRELVLFVSGLLAAHRREIATRKGTRRLGCYRQAVFGLARFRDKGDIRRLGRGLGLPQSTAHRYLDEVIEVLAARAPGLAEVLERALTAGARYLILDDPGYEGAGHGIHVPVKKPAGVKELDISTRARNALIRSARCLGERGFALLTQRWRTLQHVTASPGRIGLIAKAALVLVLFEYKMTKIVGKTSLRT
jgi:DDE superfamily endonuclease